MPRNKAFDIEDKLELARNLFWEKGYQGTSMQDIESTIGLNKSSIYSTYGNKQQLFLQCLASYAQMKLAQYRQAVPKNGNNAFEKLSHAVRDVMEQTIRDRKACLIVRTIFELGDSDKQVKQLIEKNAVVLEDIFRNLIEQAKEDGQIRKNISPNIAARYILSSFGGFYKHYVLSGNKKEVEEMIDFMLSSMKA